MPANLLDQLKDRPVPAPPLRLRAQVRERVNATLLVLQLTDLALRGLPWAMWHFALALGGLLRLTLTGQWDAKPGDDRVAPHNE